MNTFSSVGIAKYTVFYSGEFIGGRMRKVELTCDCEEIHSDVVTLVRDSLDSDTIMNSLTNFYKLFADSTRIRILCALDKHELCVCDISSLLDMTISAVSHQLKLLRESDLVKATKQGKVVYYSLKDEHVRAMIECGLEHIKEKL